MIALDPRREFHFYKERLTQAGPKSTSYFFDIPGSPYLYQYHKADGVIFGAVMDKCSKSFLSYLPKVDLN